MFVCQTDSKYVAPGTFTLHASILFSYETAQGMWLLQIEKFAKPKVVCLSILFCFIAIPSACGLLNDS